MKKVLHVIYSMTDGGAQRIIYDYFIRQRELKEYELVFLSLSAPTGSIYEKHIIKQNMNFLFLNVPRTDSGKNYIKKFLYYFKRVYGVLKILYEYHPDAIHTHVSYILKYMCIPYIFFRGKKYHTLHSDPYSFSTCNSMFFKFMFYIFSIIPIAVTSGQLKKAKDRYNLKNIFLLNNSVDIEGINAYVDSYTREDIRKSFGIPEDCFLIGSVGRLDFLKNYDFLVRIFKEYLSDNSSSCLAIAGEGPYRATLELLIEHLRLKQKVFLVGRLDFKEIYKFYKALDVFIITSLFEAAPMVFLEAQAIGVPSIIADSVDENMIYRNSVHVLSRDACLQDWCYAIHNKNSAHNQYNVKENFDTKTLMSRLEKIYSETLISIEKR